MTRSENLDGQQQGSRSTETTPPLRLKPNQEEIRDAVLCFRVEVVTYFVGGCCFTISRRKRWHSNSRRTIVGSRAIGVGRQRCHGTRQPGRRTRPISRCRRESWPRRDAAFDSAYPCGTRASDARPDRRDRRKGPPR